jgi:trehalose 6-phosphate phosphatase
MRHVLSRAGRRALERLARSGVLLAFDYDGTLAPIVEVPGRAVMRRTTRRLLARTAKRYPCVVISGRARRDVLARLRGIGVSRVVGNHGVDAGRPAGRLARRVRGWRAVLEGRLSDLRGVRIEDKTLSIAVHYRRSRHKAKARAAILEAAGGLGEVRLIGGKQVIDILPGGGSHKGTAVETERARLRCDAAIYVGDDDTDEDVFALDRPDRLLTIRVGRRGTSRASHYLRSQAEIDGLLRALVRLRPAGGPPR